MAYKDPEDKKNYDKQWRKTPKGKEYVKAHRERWEAKENSKIVMGRAYHKYSTSEKGRATRKRWRDKVKIECFEAYGNKCQCCGEAHHEALNIHHVNGGGGKHRKSIGYTNFYYWLRKNGFPQADYRLLCSNCHDAIDKNGVCFHERERSGLPA